MAQAQVDQLKNQIIGCRDLAFDTKLVIARLIEGIHTRESELIRMVERAQHELDQYRLAFPEVYRCNVCRLLCFYESEGPRKVAEECVNLACEACICQGCYEEGFDMCQHV